MKILNGVYMRALRRICNECRYGKSRHDIDIRKLLKAPSIDCLLMRSRLRYLARLVKTKPLALLSILRSKPRGKQLSWAKLVVDDMRTSRARVSLCSYLPEPAAAPQ
eukprot:4317486-Karenia_brevis.AAC.1